MFHNMMQYQFPYRFRALKKPSRSSGPIASSGMGRGFWHAGIKYQFGHAGHKKRAKSKTTHPRDWHRPKHGNETTEWYSFTLALNPDSQTRKATWPANPWAILVNAAIIVDSSNVFCSIERSTYKLIRVQYATTGLADSDISATRVLIEQNFRIWHDHLYSSTNTNDSTERWRGVYKKKSKLSPPCRTI